MPTEKITVEEYRKMLAVGGDAPAERDHKFGAKETTVDGIVFPSKLEAARYQVLLLEQRAGRITDLERQPIIPIQDTFQDAEGKTFRGATYIADFRYRVPYCHYTFIEDTKGMDTRDSSLKRKLVARAHPEFIVRKIKEAHAPVGPTRKDRK